MIHGSPWDKLIPKTLWLLRWTTAKDGTNPCDHFSAKDLHRLLNMQEVHLFKQGATTTTSFTNDLLNTETYYCNVPQYYITIMGSNVAYCLGLLVVFNL